MAVDYKKIANESRIKCLDLVFAAQSSHIGSLFSVAEIMTILFEKMKMDDKFILSAGWKVCMLYFHLWRKGKITIEQLNSYCLEGSKFIGLAEPVIPEISAAGGSMGIGFSMALGMARARKALKKPGIVYVVMSDGEMQCGNVWESTRKAVQERLTNFVVIVDWNGFCAMGETTEILDILPEDIFSRWDIRYADGHDFDSLESNIFKEIIRPTVIMADTIKGKGWKRAENNNLYHYKNLSLEEYEEARSELTNG